MGGVVWERGAGRVLGAGCRWLFGCGVGERIFGWPCLCTI